MGGTNHVKPLRVGICGLSPIAAERPETTFFGRVARSHAAGYAMHPGCDVVAVCDLRADLVTDFQTTWADTWPAVGGYSLLSHLLNEADLDILSVCTPDDAHAEPVLQAVAAGVQGILCETPLATGLADADAMLASAAARGVPVVVNHTRRFDPVFHLVRDAVELGDIGELRHLRCHHTGPRPMLFRNGSHAIDMLCFLTGASLREVSARLEPGFEHWDAYRGDGGHDPAAEPTGSLRLVFENGVTGGYDGVRSRHAALWFDIVGTDGMIRVYDRHAEVMSGGSLRTMVAPPYDTVGIAAAVTELARLIDHGGTSVSPGSDARRTIEALEAALLSHQRGSAAVRLPL